MRTLKAIAYIFCLCPFIYGNGLQLKSPDEKIEVKVNTVDNLSYSVSLNGKTLIKNAVIDLFFNNNSLKQKGGEGAASFSTINETETPLIPLKETIIPNNCNALRIDFSNEFSVEFRAYNNGIAYRFVTNMRQDVKVNEKASVEFSGNNIMWASPLVGYSCSYEKSYEKYKISGFPDSLNTYLPLLVGAEKGYKMLITEADVFDYPHMFFKKGEGNSLEAIFPPYPLETKIIGDRQSEVAKGAGYIAQTGASRSFPWRVIIISENDAQLVESNLVYLLSRGQKIEKTEWIVPGRVAWDWWNAWNLYGVDFKAGQNTQTYKYYIDFASKNGLEYIILDEGWSISTADLSKPNPAIDLQELIRYGNEKNVRIILWATWVTLDKQMFVLELFKQWGIAGIKVDFMDRADQWMVNYYEKVARQAAKYNLVVDFHGAFKPAGLRKAYPNVLSYEGVQGLEYNKWSSTVTPEHDATLPFIRMVCGPMDYTPGAMRNMRPFDHKSNHFRPMSQGTRCHQLALYVIYESGIQMFADSPSNYEREQESVDFMASVPVTWDELKVLEAKVGEYIIVARRKGDKWFIGGICNNDEHDFTIDLSFLSKGKHKAVIYRDGINANYYSEDYTKTDETVTNESKLNIHMANGGGLAVRID